MEKVIFDEYRKVHQMRQTIVHKEFPHLQIGSEKLLKMSRKISKSKGVGLDGINRRIFQIGTHRDCLNAKSANLCDECNKKLDWIRIFT